MARLSQYLRKMGSAALLASGVGAFHVDEAQRTVEVDRPVTKPRRDS